jgi:hypothetical protein
MTRHHFFNFFFPTIIPSVYTERIFPLVKSLENSVGKIPRKFTDENILSVFPFVFIDFLVVNVINTQDY